MFILFAKGVDLQWQKKTTKTRQNRKPNSVVGNSRKMKTKRTQAKNK